MNCIEPSGDSMNDLLADLWVSSSRSCISCLVLALVVIVHLGISFFDCGARKVGFNSSNGGIELVVGLV